MTNHFHRLKSDFGFSLVQSQHYIFRKSPEREKLRRRKAWSQFSQWGGDFSDDESDLLHFCRTRGLTRASTAPAQRTSATSANDRKDSVSKKPAASQNNFAMDVDLQENAKYISLLCSSLEDKLEFLRESEYQSFAPSNGENESAQTTSAGSKVVESNEKKLSAEKCEKNLNGEKEANSHSPNSKGNISRKLNTLVSTGTSDKPQNNSLPKINLRNEPETVKYAGSPELSLPLSKSSDSPTLNMAVSQSAPARRIREWNAEVETDIMRLYESGGPGANLAMALDSKPHPLKLAQVKDQVEAKLSSADHTPSYVLALANLFRKRMQIRKEFNQVSGEMTATTLKGSAISPRCNNNAFPLQNSKSTLPKQHLVTDESHSSIALRYHHVTSDGVASASDPTQGTTSTTLKSQNTAYYTFSSPISSDHSQVDATTHQTVNHETDKKLRLEVKIPTTIDLKHVRETPREEGLHSTAANVSSIPLPSENTNLPKVDSLAELLTVFPKPPQFKFAGVPSKADKQPQISIPSTNTLFGSFRTNREVLTKRERNNYNGSKDVLVVSIATNLRRAERNFRVALGKQNEKSKNVVHSSTTSFPKARKCSSAVQITPKTYQATSLPSQYKSASMSSFERDYSNSRRNAKEFLFEDDEPANDNLNVTLLPVSKVRWSGSLGTLYKKPQVTGESSQQREKTLISNVSMKKTSNLGDTVINLDTETANDYRGPADAITVSSIEHVSAVAR